VSFVVEIVWFVGDYRTTQSQQQKTPKIDKGNNVKPVEKKERANVILPNNLLKRVDFRESHLQHAC
jgi:hypothetical protein